MSVTSRQDLSDVRPSGKPKAEPVPKESFLDRELSWLEFNHRVLHEAVDPRTPLLERVIFLGIFTSNLDEFYMKRVGGLKRQVALGVMTSSSEKTSPAKQLSLIRQRVLPMLAEQARIYQEQIRPELAKYHIRLLTWDQLTREQRERASRYFRDNVFPVLTPLAVDPGHPFPFISNLSTSLGVTLRHPDRDERLFARVKVPEVLPSWVRISAPSVNDRFDFISLQELIKHNLDQLFEDMVVLNVMPFRITRNADVERDEEDAEDLLEMIEEELRLRRMQNVVRLEHGPNPDPWMLQFLIQELQLSKDDVYELPAELDYADLKCITDVPMPKLRFAPWTPVVPPRLTEDDADIFSVIRSGDLLVHHPYESFSASVERFIHAAANDPKVLAIKMTVYRTGEDSPFIKMLIRAAERGKQVLCLVELKARFDEAQNISWAQALEKAGVHVVYGIVGLKTHTKTALVVRQEADGLRCYGHIGTGNYHTGTAKLYTDLGLLTCRRELTDDLVELFHYLTGRSLKRRYRKLLVAPVNMQQRFLDLIEREVEHQRAGRPARIVAKMNALESKRICRALYRASQAGVPIDLIVRGFCCLRPGLKGISDNIRVISVIGRFLEHSRIFHFANGSTNPLEGDFFIGSADWMYRNLLARVEAITPIEEPTLRARLWEILTIMLNDQRQAWDMQPDGTYIQRVPTDSAHQVGTHQELMNLTRQQLATTPTNGTAAK